MLINNDSIEIRKESWMEVVMNKEDGYINGDLLTRQTNMWLFRTLKTEDLKMDIEHIKVLTGQREMYKVDSVYENVRGWYIHPFLALQLLAIKKYEDSDYRAKDGEYDSLDRMSKSEAQEYYKFLKRVILEDNKYDFIVDATDITCSGARGDCHVSDDTSDIVPSEEFHG